jgi:RNA polymerase sigma factor (sigma-70 family)
MSEYEKDLIDLIPLLERYAFFLTKDKDVSMDLVQDTIFKALRKKHLFKKGCNLKGWLETIMKNHFLDFVRSPSKRDKDLTDKNFELVQQRTYNIALEKINIDLLNSIIDRIPIANKVYFDMYLEGFKYREIAEHFNVPLGSVQYKIFDARAFIKNELTKLDF